MRKGALLAVAAIALAAGPAAMASTEAEARRVAQRDWAAAIVATPEGGFRMGNPAAATRIVEYVSLTCPHCAAFSATGAPALVERVRSGRLSFEIRPYPLDVVAEVGAQLNRCAAPADAFALNDAILAGLEDMHARLRAVSQAELALVEVFSEGEQRQWIATTTGIDAIAARHGVDAAEARACLADQAGTDRIRAIKAAAESIGVQGTPSFTVNGALQQDVHDWSQLAPLLGR
jgi:protein-disulfide isomerase